MKLFFINGLILVVLLFFFGSSFFGYQSPHYVKVAHEITEKTGEKLKVEKNLYLVGTGGQMMHDIEMLAMSFDYYEEVDLKTGRELIVYVINEYLAAINTNKEVRPYLHEYPFTAKNVEIRIFIYGPDRRELPLEKIRYISSREGLLRYYTGLNDDAPMYKETYDQALDEIALCQELRGEAILSKDSEYSENVTLSEVVAKDGAKVNINVISFEHSMFELNGGGFKPYEPLNVISNSCEEVLYVQIAADKNGDVHSILLQPTVIGKLGGVCHIDILREEGAISITFPWGTEIQGTLIR